MRGLVSGFIIRRRKRDISVYHVRIQQEDSSLQSRKRPKELIQITKLASTLILVFQPLEL